LQNLKIGLNKKKWSTVSVFDQKKTSKKLFHEDEYFVDANFSA